MSADYSKLLNPERALVFRIIHRANLPWILEHGLHCGNSAVKTSGWVSIGHAELITRRARHPVTATPGGVLNDYVPFYFTPFSVMMHNINTGWNGVQRYSKEDILILVSSLHKIQQLGLPFLFTDSHAYNNLAHFYRDLADIDKVDWALLQSRDFKRDPDHDPNKLSRYQAEALVHRHCPVEGLSGIVCHSAQTKIQIERALALSRSPLTVHARAGWFFE